GGINKLDVSQKRFTTYANNPYDKQSIADNLTTSIIEDHNGRLWVSGYNRTLYRSTDPVTEKTVQNLKFKTYADKIPLVDGDIVRRIYEDKRGYLWFGTDSTVVVYNPMDNVFKKVTLKENGNAARNQYTGDIYQIDKENILLAGDQFRVLENPWPQIQKNNNPSIPVKFVQNLGSQRVRTILKDTRNSFWFGTANGVLHGKFNGNGIDLDKEITDKADEKLKLSYHDIFSIHKSDDQNIWIGTFGGGLNKLSLDSSGNPVRVEYFRKNNLLPDDAIYGILQEGEKALWISTDMGLVKFHLDNDKIDVFDVRDGLPQNNFRQSSYHKGKSGYFYFGGLNGLTIFKPADIKLNAQPPEILITDLLINNKKVEIGAKLNNRFVLKKSISETENIVVSQDQQIIAFNVAVKHTSTPSKNKLAYKLEGFNDSWVEDKTGKNTITYTNLSAGEYVFKVKAANGDGVWSTDTKVLNIEILPPWYQTWWSYLIFSLLTIAICIGIIVYFVQHERLKQRLKYEKLDKERVHTINQGKFRYFTNLSHEFRTPLTLIAGPLERVMNHNSDIRNEKYLAIIQKNTKRLLSLADQLITFRKAEQGHINLNLSKNTLGGFMYPTTEAFENYSIEKNINFFYKINSPNEEIVIDVEKSERIIFNLLSNAFKNTPPGGNISIESGISNISGKKMICIDVIDTGKGIPEADLENIFERFYQLGNKHGNISGGGIGLAFCKSLLDLLGGEISVKSNPNIETRFSITIPSKMAREQNDAIIGVSEKSFIQDWVPLSSEVIHKESLETVNGALKEHTILVVENEVDVQTFLMGTLSDTYNVILANNGVEGLQRIGQQEPDLVVSDIMMPQMDGFEFCEKIKSDTATCHIPVLLLTALGENQDIIKGLEFGADEYISKPFSIKHLELRIQKLIKNNVQLKEYFSKNSALPKKDIGISKRDKEFLSNVIDIVENNISNSNFGVEELASKIGLSTSHFYRRLKQLTGQIPNVYLRNYRLQRAAELLKNNEGLNVAEVMYQIGIESNSYFSTSFKKLHGVSPSEYLKKA
ncbi:MAG: ATP-binding protein, partial [Flavobacteriaceae bacterium]